jgi:DNA repair protein RecO (recombination protein O)
MLVKSKGIVLNYIQYKETSIITKIYTEEYGLQSFIVNGVRNKKAKIGIALFQPLTLIEIVFFYKEGKGLKRINEIKCSIPLQKIPYDIKRSCVSLFISEVLYKTIGEEASDQDMFNFLYSSVLFLDQEEFNPDFHVWFLIQLSSYLGFRPQQTTDVVVKHHEYHDVIEGLLEKSIAEMNISSNQVRRNVLELILSFYGRNIDRCSDLKSFKVLNEIFST